MTIERQESFGLKRNASEKKGIFLLMMLIGGYYGAFTYSIRGGVFCNAQTGNFVLLAMALGGGSWRKAVYYLIPIAAYCMGAFISEAAISLSKKNGGIRWEPVLIVVEMAVVAFLGFLPENAPVQITQVLINFICSMQYNTFRQSQGLTMATTFCTNHIRQVGVALYHAAEGDGEAVRRLKAHMEMLGTFVLGAAVSAVLCGRFMGKAVWGALIPLAAALAALVLPETHVEKKEARAKNNIQKM